MLCGSWVATYKETGETVELFNHKLAQVLRRDKWIVECAYSYLTRINREIKQAAGADFVETWSVT